MKINRFNANKNYCLSLISHFESENNTEFPKRLYPKFFKYAQRKSKQLNKSLFKSILRTHSILLNETLPKFFLEKLKEMQQEFKQIKKGK